MNIKYLSFSLGLFLTTGLSLVDRIVTPAQAQAKGSIIATTTVTFSDSKVGNSVSDSATQLIATFNGISTPQTFTFTTSSGQTESAIVGGDDARNLVSLIVSIPPASGSIPSEILRAVPSSTLSIPAAPLQQLINSENAAGRSFATIIASLSLTPASLPQAYTPLNTVLSNTAILVVAMQGMISSDRKIDPARFLMAVRALNAMITATKTSGITDAQRNNLFGANLFKATQAFLGILVDASYKAEAAK